MSLKIGALASGSGSNFQAICDSVARGALDAEIKVLLCNRPDAYVLQRAKENGVPSVVYENSAAPTREAFDELLVETLRRFDVEVAVLAGYMRILSSVMVEAFAGKILNIHPSILPAFKGLRGLEEAKASGVKLAGCSAHFVDEKLDHGPVIIQAATPVFPGESVEDLKARVHRQEHRIYPQALQWIAQNRVAFCDDMRTTYIKDHKKANQPSFSQEAFIYPALEEGF